MKTLIAFYSRTGTTRKVAKSLARILKCDIEEIIDTKDRSGASGYMQAGKEATLETKAKIKPLKKSPAKYDLVIIGTPVWAWNMSAPIRTYISENKRYLKDVAFFCTFMGSGGLRTITKMKQLSGKKPIAHFIAKTGYIIKNDFSKQLKEFAIKLKSGSKR